MPSTWLVKIVAKFYRRLKCPLTRHLATENAAACSNGRNAEAVVRLVATCACPLWAAIANHDRDNCSYLMLRRIGPLGAQL